MIVIENIPPDFATIVAITLAPLFACVFAIVLLTIGDRRLKRSMDRLDATLVEFPIRTR